MSKNYEKVKEFYENGLWSITRVRSAVGKWITEQEYEGITGEVYQMVENGTNPDRF